MVKLHDSIPAINGKLKFNSKINIPSVNIYNALFLYLFLCLCESAFSVVLISSLAMLIPYRPARLAVPAIVTLAHSFFGTQEGFMSGLTIFFLIIGFIICERRIKPSAKADSANSYKRQLILFVLSAIAVILIVFLPEGFMPFWMD